MAARLAAARSALVGGTRTSALQEPWHIEWLLESRLRALLT